MKKIKICPNCGTQNDPEDRFCLNCQTNIADIEAVEAPNQDKPGNGGVDFGDNAAVRGNIVGQEIHADNMNVENGSTPASNGIDLGQYAAVRGDIKGQEIHANTITNNYTTSGEETVVCAITHSPIKLTESTTCSKCNRVVAKNDPIAFNKDKCLCTDCVKELFLQYQHYYADCLKRSNVISPEVRKSLKIFAAELNIGSDTEKLKQIESTVNDEVRGKRAKTMSPEMRKQEFLPLIDSIVAEKGVFEKQFQKLKGFSSYDDEQAQYWYYLLYSSFYPAAAIADLEKSDTDHYWQHFWIFMARAKNADMVLPSIDELIDLYPEHKDAPLAICLYNLFQFYEGNCSNQVFFMNAIESFRSIEAKQLSAQLETVYKIVSFIISGKEVPNTLRVKYRFFMLRILGYKQVESTPEPIVSEETVSEVQAEKTNEAAVSPAQKKNKPRAQKPIPAPVEEEKGFVLSDEEESIPNVNFDDEKDDDDYEVSSSENYNDYDNSSNGRSGKKVAIIIVAAVLIIGAVVFFVMRNKGEKAQETPIVEMVQEDAGTAEVPVEEQETQPVQKQSKYTQTKEEENTAPIDFFKDGYQAYSTGDFAKAFECFEKLPDNMQAQYYIGMMYLNGNGVTKHAKKAFDAFYTAASGGCKEAYYPLAELYNTGKGTSRSVTEALVWYQKAAKAGNDAAAAKYNELKASQTNAQRPGNSAKPAVPTASTPAVPETNDNGRPSAKDRMGGL